MQQNILRFAAALLAVVFLASASTAQMRSNKFGVGVGGSVYLFSYDGTEGLLKPGGSLNLSYSIFEHIGIRAMFGAGQLGWKTGSTNNTTTLLSGNLYVSYDVLPHSAFNPFVFGGVGGIYFDPHTDAGIYATNSASFDKMDLNYLGGVGFDYFFSEFLSVTVSGEAALTNTDWLDGVKSVSASNDNYKRINIEFRYYFFDQQYVTNLIKALQERMRK